MNCLIFGAGKIARGFIGHLLYLSGARFVFVEKSDELADLINKRGCYTVNVLGAPEKNTLVTGVCALKYDDSYNIACAVSGADAVFTAVGGKNLAELPPILAKGIMKKSQIGGSLNIIACENWKQPGAFLRNDIRRLLDAGYHKYFDYHVGVTEAVVMRSAIEADELSLRQDPLTVNVQDFWDLPVDASRVAGLQSDNYGGRHILLGIRSLRLVDGFAGFLERKFYTYNAANGTVSYAGALLGYHKIADAAHDERILKILSGVYDETSRALSVKYKIPLEDQTAFAKTSLDKLQDYTIVDYIERNARDPIRKLGPDDRLTGAARMVMEYGVKPDNLALAIACAVYYKNPKDPSAVELAQIRSAGGIDGVLEKVCKIGPSGELFALVRQKAGLLKDWGWIHE